MSAPWLIIAPHGNPVARLDLRVLDRIELNSDDHADHEGPKQAWGCELLLVCGDLEVAIYIADGVEAAARVVRAAAPLTRERSAAPPERAAISSGAVPAEIPLQSVTAALVAKFLVLSSHDFDAPAGELDRCAGMELELTRPQMIIGRTQESDLVLAHRSISRDHARVTRDPDTERYTICDLRSDYGVRVNGERGMAFELRHDDIVDLGRVRMRFVEPGQDFELAHQPTDLEQFVVIGRDAVVQRGDYIQVGKLAFRIGEVRDYALKGANLPLPQGALLQAAVALLVVAAAERDSAPPPWLGIRVDGAQPRVIEVVEGTPADNAGVRVGDEIVSIAVTSPARPGTVPLHPLDKRVMLRLRRDDHAIEVALTLERPPPDAQTWTTLIDRAAPAFIATTLDGRSLSSRDLAGQVVVLDFWDTSCDLCKQRVPQLSALHGKYPDLRLVGVSTENASEIQRAGAALSIHYALVRDGSGTMSKDYLDPVPPMLVVIDKEGMVWKVESGLGDFDTLEAELVELMK